MPAIAVVAGLAVNQWVLTVRLDEPYLRGYADPDLPTECTAVTVPAGHLYVLGDHRVVSLDSRRVGPLPTSAVHGRMLTDLGRL